MWISNPVYILPFVVQLVLNLFNVKTIINKKPLKQINDLNKPVCKASSYVGERMSTWGYFKEVSTRQSDASKKAAVLPVPDWDWAMMFEGLWKLLR